MCLETSIRNMLDSLSLRRADGRFLQLMVIVDRPAGYQIPCRQTCHSWSLSLCLDSTPAQSAAVSELISNCSSRNAVKQQGKAAWGHQRETQKTVFIHFYSSRCVFLYRRPWNTPAVSFWHFWYLYVYYLLYVSSVKSSLTNGANKLSYCNWLNSRRWCAPFKADENPYRASLQSIMQSSRSADFGGTVRYLFSMLSSAGSAVLKLSPWLWTWRRVVCRAATRHKRHFKIRCEGWRICRNPILTGFQTTSNCGLDPICDEGKKKKKNQKSFWGIFCCLDFLEISLEVSDCCLSWTETGDTAEDLMIETFKTIGVLVQSLGGCAAAQLDGSLELQTFNYLITFTPTVES